MRSALRSLDVSIGLYFGCGSVDDANDPDRLWSTETGAELTLHLVRVGGGTTSETRVAEKAIARFTASLEAGSVTTVADTP